MDIDKDFKLQPLPPVVQRLARASGASPKAPPTPLGPLQGFLGTGTSATWSGTGFNMIWRPNNTPESDHFLELNVTTEILQFSEIPGPIANRGLLQEDIEMFGLTYLQQISDRNVGAGLHVEPGIWAVVPRTTNPAEVSSIVRMASIPHGTTVLAQGIASETNERPIIPSVDITPFSIGSFASKVPFTTESDLATPSVFRSAGLQIKDITQAMLNNPNSVLTDVLAPQTVLQTTVLEISSDPSSPVIGGGVANTAFLQGRVDAGPNARTALVSATFWLETIQGKGGAPDFQQLQYSQMVLLNFNGLSWPHVSVGTLTLEPVAK